MNERHFLLYQRNWLKDRSRIKLWEKSRRIGATYTQAYEDVEDCATKSVPAVWFSSADESAAREYIEYCRHWAKLFNIASVQLGEELFDEDKDVKTFGIDFPKLGRRINALSSNPKTFRSKGGKIVLDEFAHHSDQKTLWAAARPCITWGFPLRVISTHNGNSKFNQFIKDIVAGKLTWSRHRVPIHDAVAQGLADRITGRKLTDEERAAWIEEERKNCGDPFTWQQEYLCMPVDEATAFLTYEMIEACERADLVLSLDGVVGDLYLGMDIGRKKDLSVIWILEKIGPMRFTRRIVVMERTPFHIQQETLFELLRHPKMRRACIDSTGIGAMLAEEAQRFFGKYRVESVNFSNSIKEDLAFGLRSKFEDKTLVNPGEQAIREDLHSIRRLTTTAGNIRFDVASEETDGHADRFWALALAVHAGGTESGPITIVTRRPHHSKTMFKGY